MTDYIKREDALKAVNGIHEDDLPRNNKIEVCDVLTLVPSADVVQVIRCKDCKYSRNDELWHMRWCKGLTINEEHFCADGERSRR